MTNFLEKALLKLAKLQKKHTLALLAIIIILSVFLGSGLSKFRIQTDFSKELPQDLPFFILEDKVNDKFGGQDLILVVVTLSDEHDIKNLPADIRNERVINFMADLEDVLKQESLVDRVDSPASFFDERPSTDAEVRETISRVPSDQFFGRTFKTALMFVLTDVGNSETKIREVSRIVEKRIESLQKPPGVEVSITGTPVLRLTIFDLIKRDLVFTLALAAIIILILLFLIERSPSRALLVFTPLMLGMLWTLGSMGWLNLALSLPTVAIGAMILGLGVEYGTFMVSRYKEERDKGKNQSSSLETAVKGIGSAISGSGLTTIIGFSALSFSVLPLLQHMGQTLALGIFFSLVSALFVTPVFILLEEDFERWWYRTKFAKISEKLKNARER